MAEEKVILDKTEITTQPDSGCGKIYVIIAKTILLLIPVQVVAEEMTYGVCVMLWQYAVVMLTEQQYRFEFL